MVNYGVINRDMLKATSSSMAMIGLDNMTFVAPNTAADYTDQLYTIADHVMVDWRFFGLDIYPFPMNYNTFVNRLKQIPAVLLPVIAAMDKVPDQRFLILCSLGVFDPPSSETSVSEELWN